MYRLHHVPVSRSFRVLWLLEELGLETEISYYSIRDGSMQDPAYLALSPAGRAPALEMGDTVMFESGAIVEYLAETHAESGLHRAPGDPERRRYLEALHFAETMAQLIENLNLSHVFLRPPAKPSVAVLKVTTARLRRTMQVMADMLAGKDHLLASGFSAADIMMAYNLRLARYYVPVESIDGLAAYRDRMAARPAYQRALARDGEQDIYAQDFYPIPGA